MKVEFNGKEYGFDGYLHRNISEIKNMIRKDDDCVIIVDGRERSGKSVLAMQVACALDPTMTLDRVTFTPKEFKEMIFRTDKYKCVILDEAMDIFYSKESQSWINKFFNKMLAKIGQKNLIVILVLPSFFELDKYPALHRSRVLLHVYTNKKKRGFFAFYNYSRKLQLHIKGKKFYNYKGSRPNFKGRFSNYYPLDEQEYRKKKGDSLVEDSGEDLYTTKYKIQRNWVINELHKHISERDIEKCMEDCEYPLKQSSIGTICKEGNHGKGKRIGTDSNPTGGDSKESFGETEGDGREDGEV
jgi:hypothetical protein